MTTTTTHRRVRQGTLRGLLYLWAGRRLGLATL